MTILWERSSLGSSHKVKYMKQNRCLKHQPAAHSLQTFFFKSEGGALGHPLEYMQLNLVEGEFVECKYCGLRYKAKHQ